MTRYRFVTYLSYLVEIVKYCQLFLIHQGLAKHYNWSVIYQPKIYLFKFKIKEYHFKTLNCYSFIMKLFLVNLKVGNNSFVTFLSYLKIWLINFHFSKRYSCFYHLEEIKVVTFLSFYLPDFRSKYFLLCWTFQNGKKTVTIYHTFSIE